MGTPAVFAMPDGLAMRRTMGRFLTGVAVVTTDHDGEQYGMTINSLTSISLDPPILMISLNFNTRTGDAVLASGKFAVSILGAKQEAVARQFAQRGGPVSRPGTSTGPSADCQWSAVRCPKQTAKWSISTTSVITRCSLGRLWPAVAVTGRAWHLMPESSDHSGTSTTTPCRGRSRNGTIAVTVAPSRAAVTAGS